MARGGARDGDRGDRRRHNRDLALRCGFVLRPVAADRVERNHSSATFCPA